MKKNIYFFRGRLPAQKDKRLYPNSSPRSRTKSEKKKTKILTIFFPSNWRLAAGAFFCSKIMFLGEKDNFPRPAACRRRLFLPKNDQNHFPPAGLLPQAPFFFFLTKIAFLWEKYHFPPAGGLPQALFLLAKNCVLGQK